MNRNIKVEFVGREPIEEQEIEIVERKGLGHPDSLCDGIAEAVSVALCKEYKRKCGVILHHNTDKVQLVAGRSNPRYGGGEVISPIYILLGGRATRVFEGEEIAVDIVATNAAKDYLRVVRNLDVDRQVIVDSKLGGGSSDLLEVFKGNNDERVQAEIPIANDTSFGVAHAPLSECESIALNVEGRVMAEYRNKEKAIGEDMKVMALREKDRITLTVGDAFVSRYVEDYEHYEMAKREFKSFISGVAETRTAREVNTQVNMADTPDSVYLTVTGTSAEMGDDGATGRGNRCNGLITPNRPMSLEATPGKNPVNHTGKIYNLLANKIANEVVENVDGIREVHIKILSEIGRRIDDPKVATAQIIPKSDVNRTGIEKKVMRITDEWLSNIAEITEMAIRGELRTF
ncbi:S-adenosylmethionine synthetase [ANME-1 cluster archaeon GoMg4]|nr:S-adenosylmethionine synthetase [ANME-1 cluster archaeon GoMg4]